MEVNWGQGVKVLVVHGKAHSNNKAEHGRSNSKDKTVQGNTIQGKATVEAFGGLFAF